MLCKAMMTKFWSIFRALGGFISLFGICTIFHMRNRGFGLEWPSWPTCVLAALSGGAVLWLFAWAVPHVHKRASSHIANVCGVSLVSLLFIVCLIDYAALGGRLVGLVHARFELQCMIEAYPALSSPLELLMTHEVPKGIELDLGPLRLKVPEEWEVVSIELDPGLNTFGALLERQGAQPVTLSVLLVPGVGNVDRPIEETLFSDLFGSERILRRISPCGAKVNPRGAASSDFQFCVEVFDTVPEEMRLALGRRACLIPFRLELKHYMLGSTGRHNYVLRARSINAIMGPDEEGRVYNAWLFDKQGRLRARLYGRVVEGELTRPVQDLFGTFLSGSSFP